MELIDKKELAKAALDENSETFVVHVRALRVSKPAGMPIHPFRAAQIISQSTGKPTLAALQWDKAPTEIPSEYSDYATVFLADLAMELTENTGMNKDAIELIESKQPPFGPIYSLGQVELETLKTYIENHLKTESPAGVPIFFNKKPDGSLCLCVNYRGLNNLTIKNQYLLHLISKSLDRLGRAKRFTQLDLISVYHKMRIHEGDEWKTAFRTRYGHFEYQVMPFGLWNAPASFKRYINKILTEKLNIYVIVYLDNILISTKDPG